MNLPKKRLLVISVMGEDDALAPGLFDGAPEGENDLAWIRRRLRQAGLESGYQLEFVDISQGGILPSADCIDAVIVGGSIHNANEGRDWQRRGIDWLRGFRKTRRPLLGLCGGHQLATVALGGTVAVMDDGPYASTEAIELTASGRRHYLFEGCRRAPRVHLGHFDHVDRPPPGSTVLAHYRAVVMALDMGGDWITVQFHPEASADLMVKGWDGKLGDLEGCYLDAHEGRRIVANFFLGTGLADDAREEERAQP